MSPARNAEVEADGENNGPRVGGGVDGKGVAASSPLTGTAVEDCALFDLEDGPGRDDVPRLDRLLRVLGNIDGLAVRVYIGPSPLRCRSRVFSETSCWQGHRQRTVSSLALFLELLEREAGIKDPIGSKFAYHFSGNRRDKRKIALQL